jgi:ABC-type uncharacterized transport system fused permease/ATPase subunit
MHPRTQDAAEGSFRFAHNRVATYCESVTFYRGEKKEKGAISSLFSEVVRAYKRFIQKVVVLQSVAVSSTTDSVTSFSFGAVLVA